MNILVLKLIGLIKCFYIRYIRFFEFLQILIFHFVFKSFNLQVTTKLREKTIVKIKKINFFKKPQLSKTSKFLITILP